MTKTDSLDLSLPESREVRGCEISRAPLGVFLRAMKQLQAFPAQLLSAVFPGMSLQEILTVLKTGNTETMGEILFRACAVAPEQAIKLVGAVTGIPAEKLEDDPKIGLDGLAEIVTAWVEVNRIENFTQAATGLLQRFRAQKGTSTGSST